MRCPKCKHNLFEIEEMPECEDCENNGAYTSYTSPSTSKRIYDDKEIKKLNLVRDEVENDGECLLGSCFNDGCHIYICADCGHKTMWPAKESQ